MDDTPIKQVFDELYSLLEELETKNIAILRFLREEGVTPEEKMAYYLGEASNATSVKWRAARVRMEHLFASPPRQATDEVSKPEKASKKAELEEAKPEKPKPQKTKPQKSQLPKSQPAKSEPAQAESPTAAVSKTESKASECPSLSETEQGQTKRDQAKQDETKRNSANRNNNALKEKQAHADERNERAGKRSQPSDSTKDSDAED